MARDKRRADIAKFLKIYRDFGAPAGTPAEQTIWIILARHGTKEGATRALNALWRRYVDVNELRVAKASEVSAIISRHVRNESIVVAEATRGFLRRFHKDQHTIDFGITRTMTVEQLRKYLAGAEEFVAEMALALFVYYCAAEAEEEAAATAETDPKAKKRPEKEITLAAERLRMLGAVAATGTVVAKTKQTTAARNLAKAWSYAPLPAATAAPAGKTSAKKTTTAARARGTARPKTTRTTRKRPAKKSSRR